jgi:hypothetical protein
MNHLQQLGSYLFNLRAAMRALGVVLLLALAGCATAPTPSDYAAQQPALDLREYFAGTVDGWGVVQDRSGKVTRRFKVEIVCTWKGDEGVLDETFWWSDGKTEKRVWKIRKDGTRYTGTAGDVVGTATGVAAGNALQWNYVLRLPPEQGSYEVNMDDWMWLIDDKTLANQTVMTKFGIKFAEINILFRKR